jgi:nitroreductase
MKDFLSLAKARKTTYEFSSKPIPVPTLKKILEAGRWAPSPLNSQPWEFIVIKDKNEIKQSIKASYFGIFHTLPSVIIAISLIREKSSSAAHRGMLKGKLGHDESMMAVSLPVLMMALEADDMGIGACILSLDESKLMKRLGAGKGRRVPIAVGLGYPEKGSDSAGTTHKRKPLSELVRGMRL